MEPISWVSLILGNILAIHPVCPAWNACYRTLELPPSLWMGGGEQPKARWRWRILILLGFPQSRSRCRILIRVHYHLHASLSSRGYHWFCTRLSKGEGGKEWSFGWDESSSKLNAAVHGLVECFPYASSNGRAGI